MIAKRRGVKIMVIGPIPHVQPLTDIFDRVGMNKINQHLNIFRVGIIDQLFQIIRRPKLAGRRKEVADMVPERSVIGMLGYRHHLDHVVA